MEQPVMTREKVFGRLRDLGVKVAMVEYHGGGDESFIERVGLHTLNRHEIQDYDAPAIALGEPGFMDGTPDEDELAEALIQPIYDYLGEAFGDSVEGVGGMVVWYVGVEKVMIEHRYLDWVHEEKEL